MANMDLVGTTSRSPVNIRLVWIVASLLFVLGSWLVGQGLWIHVKAVAAQWLLQDAWHKTLNIQRPIKPWPWADTWPIGQLMVTRLGINQIILANPSGQSLAFGPAKVENRNSPDDDSQSLILSGHQDTHFSFLQNLQIGDSITVKRMKGDRLRYVVEESEVLDSRTERLTINQEEAQLRLITCYPFDALLPGGPLRYVVTAKPVPLGVTPPSTPLGGS